jgi:hypothetical protein
MKKTVLFVVLALLAVMLLAQEQEKEQIPVVSAEQSQAEPLPSVPPQEQLQAQPAEPAPAPAPGRDLKRIRFPQAFVHAGKEYAAGDYWLVLTARDGQPVFTVRNPQQELLFDDLAIVKPRSGKRSGRGFVVSKHLMKDGEYFRVKVTTPGEWLLGYFLVKK